MKSLIIILSLIPSFAAAQNNPVVIELFTSQGCSSCPAADKNLADLIETAEKNGQPVFGVSYHVDYWNHIGWKDPYSDPAFTARQKRYAEIMNSEGIYTPQMIVNGIVEFVGSRQEESRDAVARALGQKADYSISLGTVQRGSKKIVVPYRLGKMPFDLTINVALVERRLENDVPRGENAGRKLTHRNVVRSLVSGVAQETGTIEIELPDHLSAGSLIVFLQDKQWHVRGASAAVLY
jgi:hypothetical protein